MARPDFLAAKGRPLRYAASRAGASWVGAVPGAEAAVCQALALPPLCPLLLLCRKLFSAGFVLLRTGQ